MHLSSWLVSGWLILLLQTAYGTEQELDAHLPRPGDGEDAEDMIKESVSAEDLIDLVCSCRQNEKERVQTRPLDCSDLKDFGFTRSGHYDIFPLRSGVSDVPVKVWCDMDTKGGGWTVIQRREDGSVNFARKWDDYKRGFGYAGGEFWLGNDNLHDITHQNSYELRVEVELRNGSRSITNVNHIRVADESAKYELYVGSSDSEGVCDSKSTLGMEDGRIQAHQLTASSEYPCAATKPCNANSARLNLADSSTTYGAWIAKDNNANQWIQVELGGWRLVTGVITQGRSGPARWIKNFKVQYSDDGTSWTYVKDNSGQDVDFVGNSDQQTPVTNVFDSPVITSFIRIQPTAWQNYINLRFELLGCNAYSWTNLNYQPFSTQDTDNDGNDHSNCAADGGAWWYGNACAQTGLNGEHLKGVVSANKGIAWENKGTIYYVRRTEMKIRPSD